MKPSTGLSILYNTRKNKGTAFDHEERLKYGLLGILPDGIETMETQLLRVKEQYLPKFAFNGRILPESMQDRY